MSATPQPLTRTALSGAVCHVDGDGHERIYLHGACHPSAGSRASYDKNTGVLDLACRQCRKPIASFLVAP